MNTWKGYVVVNGDGVTIFREVKFDVPDKLYKKIQNAITKNIPLVKCDFYNDLNNRLEKAFDLAEVVGLIDEKPVEEDYEDDKEGFREAMKEYKEAAESLWDSYVLEESTIYDPGDLERFKESLLGKTFPQYEGEKETIREFEFNLDGEICRNYCTSVTFNQKGTIVDVDAVNAEGLYGDTVKGSNYDACYPDYDIVFDMIIEELEEEREDWKLDHEENES